LAVKDVPYPQNGEENDPVTSLMVFFDAYFITVPGRCLPLALHVFVKLTKGVLHFILKGGIIPLVRRIQAFGLDQPNDRAETWEGYYAAQK